MSACTCYPVPEEYWTTHYGAVDPATTLEPNPDCPEHFPAEVTDLSPSLVGKGRVFTAPAGTPVEAMLAAMRQMGASADQAADILTRFGERVGSPRQELLFRLNERLRGRDPGKPVHWRGLAA